MKTDEKTELDEAGGGWNLEHGTVGKYVIKKEVQLVSNSAYVLEYH